jgi:hypothetical protein
MKHLATALIFTIFSILNLSATECCAMDFSRSGLDLYGRGDINAGDSDKLIAALGYDDGISQSYIHLNSNGGDLFEGIKIGEIIHHSELETVIDADGSCFSACAIAFLGGVRRYVTGEEPGRVIRWGAQLGFHGFYSSGQTVNFENSVLEKSRLINGIILEYAQEMGGIDLGWLAEALTFPPDQVKLANRPRDIAALSAIVQGGPSEFPDNWDDNICIALMRSHGASDAEQRMYNPSKIIPKIHLIRALTADVIFSNEPLRSLAARLSDDAAITLALGRGFDLTYYKPIEEARAKEIERGYGFHYDNCVTIRTKVDGVAIIVDSLNRRIEWQYFGGAVRGGDEQNPILDFYNIDEKLWN